MGLGETSLSCGFSDQIVLCLPSRVHELLSQFSLQCMGNAYLYRIAWAASSSLQKIGLLVEAQALLLSAGPLGLYTYKYTKGGQVWFVDIQPCVDGSHADHILLI